MLGEKRAPNIVFEHPGETTIPTSIFVCETGGMVVVCAGTTGYNATVDLRYLWMRQKRLQGDGHRIELEGPEAPVPMDKRARHAAFDEPSNEAGTRFGPAAIVLLRKRSTTPRQAGG